MFYRIPEEFFFTVIKVDESKILDSIEEEESSKKDSYEKNILKEADDEYLESEIG